MDYMNKWREEKILKKNKNYEDYPNQMKNELQKQINKYNLEIFKYQKTNYNLYAILKDKNDDRYVCIRSNDLICFKEPSYKNITINVMKNPNIENRTMCVSSSWNEIGSNARRLIEWKKKNEINQKEVEEDMDLEK